MSSLGEKGVARGDAFCRTCVRPTKTRKELVKKLVLAAIMLLLLVPAAFAQHAYGDNKGPRGGAIQEVAGIEAECRSGQMSGISSRGSWR